MTNRATTPPPIIKPSRRALPAKLTAHLVGMMPLAALALLAALGVLAPWSLAALALLLIGWLLLTRVGRQALAIARIGLSEISKSNEYSTKLTFHWFDSGNIKH